jgi:short-subunit dehydrogenase
VKIEAGQTALVTGASRGMGVIMARALARRGVNLIIAARSAALLQQVAADLTSSCKVKVEAIAVDLGDSAALTRLATDLNARGGVDILLNNAGLESACIYDQADPAEIEQMIAVNLTGPMLLSRLLLPGMLQRGRGHIVNIASVAGLMATPYEETYNASKFGLVGFSRALRLTAQDRGWPVGVSVICPGFMSGTGMYQDMNREHAVTAPKLLGTVSAEAMGPALIRAVEQDLPDVILMKGTPRINAALGVLAPRVYAWMVKTFDLAGVFRTVAERRAAG